MVFSGGSTSLFELDYSGSSILNLTPRPPGTSMACFVPMENFLVITRGHSSYTYIHSSMCDGIRLDNHRKNQWSLYGNGHIGRDWIFCNGLLHQHDLRITKSYTSLDASTSSSALYMFEYDYRKRDLNNLIARFWFRNFRIINIQSINFINNYVFKN